MQSREERDTGGSRRGDGEKGGLVHFYENALRPPFLPQVVQINTASLIRILNSKPKSIIQPFIDYSFPNIYRGLFQYTTKLILRLTI